MRMEEFTGLEKEVEAFEAEHPHAAVSAPADCWCCFFLRAITGWWVVLAKLQLLLLLLVRSQPKAFPPRWLRRDDSAGQPGQGQAKSLEKR
ncbi:hypothetical protein ACOSQ2_003221 [Xanthoceras sorbifolium]